MTEEGQRRATNAQAERRTRNQTIFRAVNNRIQDINDAFGEWDQTGFLCECGTARCESMVEMNGREYGAVRVEPTRFLTAVGHFEPTVDRVVEQGERYWIVETLPGVPTRVARETAGPT